MDGEYSNGFEMQMKGQSSSDGQTTANRGRDSQFPPATAAAAAAGSTSNPPPTYYPQSPPGNQYVYPPYPSGGQPYPQGYPTGHTTPQYPQPSPAGFSYPAGAVASQQQQQVTFVNGQPQTIVVCQQAGVSMTSAIIFSCFAYWCCCPLFGGIAFILAIVGQNSLDDVEKMRLRRASYGLSIAAFIIGVVIVSLAVGISRGLYYNYYNYNNNYYSYSECSYNSYGYGTYNNCK